MNKYFRKHAPTKVEKGKGRNPMRGGIKLLHQCSMTHRNGARQKGPEGP